MQSIIQKHKIEIIDMGAEIGLIGNAGALAIHAINFWALKIGKNTPQLAIATVYNVLLILTWMLVKHIRRFQTFPRWILFFVYLIFQEIWINICIRDLLSPLIKLDRSDVTMFDYQKLTFVITTCYGLWDFKLTLFVLSPIYLTGYYFMLQALNQIV